jgi:hypothetical protein
MFGLTWRIWKSLIYAAAVPAIAIAPIAPFVAPGVFILAFLIALVAAYPLFTLLRHYSIANRWTSCLIGSLLGALVASVMFWPNQHLELRGTSWRRSGADIVYTKIAGVPTQAAWNDFFVVAVIFGLVGAAAGFVYWYNGIRERGERQAVEGRWHS